ncbi:MAG: septum formation initiator family protein [Clostridia bacterium]|nr:septum formation initiator family protein [Clostridia bacterium]
MQEVKVKKRKGSLLLKIAVFCFAVFLVSMLIGQQVSIGQKREELKELEQALREQEVINDELRYDLEADNRNSNEYAEKVARRELDYVKPGERVFYNVGGNN